MRGGGAGFLLVGFVAVIIICLLLSVPGQTYNNAIWQAKNNPTVQTSMNWLPCIGLLVIGIPVSLWFFSGMLGSSGDASMTLEIWDRNHEEKELDNSGGIIAYRYFTNMPDGELYSVGKGVLGDNPITGRERGSYGGGYNISDRVPTLKNTSGIYAAKSRNSHILDPFKYAKGDTMVLGKVRLSGKIVEAEYGYRAQYCEVLEIYQNRR